MNPKCLYPYKQYRLYTTAWTLVAYMDVGKGRKHDRMDVGGRTMSGTIVEERKLTPLRGVQEIERIRTNIGHIRVKMSGT